jgi:hypothetical protein
MGPEPAFPERVPTGRRLLETIGSKVPEVTVLF